jgi:hypothetical protein
MWGRLASAASQSMAVVNELETWLRRSRREVWNPLKSLRLAHPVATCRGSESSSPFCVLYHQAPGQRHGVGHQPFHCGVAWRAVVGKRQQRRGRNFSFYLADPSDRVITFGCINASLSPVFGSSQAIFRVPDPMPVVAIVPYPTPARLRPLDAIVPDTMKSTTRRTSSSGSRRFDRKRSKFGAPV